MTFIADTNDPIYEGTNMYTGDVDLTDMVIVLVANMNAALFLAASGPGTTDWPNDMDDVEFHDVPDHHGYWVCYDASYNIDTDIITGKWRPCTLQDLEDHSLGLPVIEDEDAPDAIYEANAYGLWTPDGSHYVAGIGMNAGYRMSRTDENVYFFTYKNVTTRIQAATFAQFVEVADALMSTASRIMHSAIVGYHKHYKGDTYYLAGTSLDSDRDVPMYRYTGPDEREFTKMAHIWHQMVVMPFATESEPTEVKRFTHVG